MIHHICNKSIAGFQIFNNDNDYKRILIAILYYLSIGSKPSLSDFLRSFKNKKCDIFEETMSLPKKQDLLSIIAYCIMPTHIHLVLNVLKENLISVFMNNVLNSYTRYFNIRYNRKGPLWVGPHKKILIETDEQLLYVTGYVHTNPVKAKLINKPEKWLYSSYREYISKMPNSKKVCSYNDILDVKPFEYKKFVEDMIMHQQELAQIKHLFIE